MKRKYMIAMVALGLLLLVGQVGLAEAWTWTLPTWKPAAPPAAPANLTATLTPGATTHTVTLKWAANTGNAYSYQIDRIDWNTGKKSFTIWGGTSASHVQTGLAKNSTYRFRIKANTLSGSSTWSPMLEMTTP